MANINLMASGNWLPFNIKIAKALGSNNAAILLSELANRLQSYERNDTVDEYGWFYATHKSIEEYTNLTRRKQDAAIKLLIDSGLIETTLKGMPSKRYFRFTDNCNQVLDSLLTGCKKPTSKVVRNQQARLQETDKQGCKKPTNKIVRNQQQYILSNNTNNETKLNNTKSYVEKLDDYSKNDFQKDFQNDEIMNNESDLENQEKENHPPVADSPLKENAEAELTAMKAELAAMKQENERLAKKAAKANKNRGFEQTDEEQLQIAANPKKTSNKSKQSVATDEVIDYLNEKAGTRYRKNTVKTVSSVAARIEEYGVDVLKAIIDVKCLEWLGTKMQMYLRPDTLFNKTKCEIYANNLIQSQRVPVRPKQVKKRTIFNAEKMAALGQQVNEMAAAMGM